MPIFRQIFLPYCLLNTKDGWFQSLNREYKPLGPEVRIRGLTIAKAEKIGLRDGGNFLYLYNDGTQPQSSEANWRRYEQILERLMRMEVEVYDGKSPRRSRRWYSGAGKMLPGAPVSSRD